MKQVKRKEMDRISISSVVVFVQSAFIILLYFCTVLTLAMPNKMKNFGGCRFGGCCKGIVNVKSFDNQGPTSKLLVKVNRPNYSRVGRDTNVWSNDSQDIALLKLLIRRMDKISLSH